MTKKKLKKGDFKITVRYSSMSEKEKEKLLFECFDILLSNNPKRKKPNSEE